MHNNDTQPTPGFKIANIDIHMRRYPHNIVKPGESMFIRLDVSGRKKTITRQYSNGQEFTTDVDLDDKGIEQISAAECVEALFRQYRVRINTWRRANQFTTAFTGPTPEVHSCADSECTTH